ncbi:MAG: hypothetical protein U0935_15885 [Pirellulales bacterium]
MNPLISLQLRSPRRVFWPGETFECRYQIDAVEAHEIQSVESSVLWYSEGKGDEDLGVHAFQRRVPGDVTDGDLRRLTSIETVLPNSPLSYSGMILKIRWCVRVRVFWGRGKVTTAELAFRLGDVPDPNFDSTSDEGAATVGLTRGSERAGGTASTGRSPTAAGSTGSDDDGDD